MDDLISRQAAIDTVKYDYFTGYTQLERVNEIKAIPAADVVEVVHGYWIRHDDADIVEGYYVPEYECSECKGWVKDDTDFCPNCGIKMDGGKDNG